MSSGTRASHKALVDDIVVADTKRIRRYTGPFWVFSNAEDVPAAEGSGRDYMLARLTERRSAERLSEEIHAPLAAMARAATKSVGATPQLLLSASYLVARDDEQGFRSALGELERDHPDLTLASTGPWPPYSFATAEVEPE